jgi:tetratricopeptide (TPR) repeat protein
MTSTTTILLSKIALPMLALMLGIPTAYSHDEHVTSGEPPPEKLGRVSFSVSCNSAAQEEFNRGMALFHSFWFNPAIQSFRKVAQHDPECGMAHWGIAIMSLGNPFGWPPAPKAWQAGASALADAQRVGVKSQREKDYIDALTVFFKGWETTDYRPRATAFSKAMENVAQRYPNDSEAQILHAIVLDATALSGDKTFANQQKAAGILEPLFAKYPDHPGVAHYLIHTYDYAELAEKGLPAARKYARIAPSVPHALHMPSHIFGRLGLWPEMTESNYASYQAAKNELKETTLGVGTYDALHAMDYLVFAHLQRARDQAAKRIVEDAASSLPGVVENFVAAYALAAIPARYALERGDWVGAASLELSPAGLEWNKFPQAEAALVFARGLGAARAGNAASGRKDVTRLEALREAMGAAKLDYWASQADFQIMAVSAWLALAENNKDDALRLMAAAADAEEATNKHPVTPANVASTRELLGEMLLELGRPEDAFAQFERSLKREPNRFRAISGAARAAEASGNRKEARRYYTQLQTVAGDYDTERRELTQAKIFLAK